MALSSAGVSSERRTTMMVITTRSSMRVKACRIRRLYSPRHAGGNLGATARAVCGALPPACRGLYRSSRRQVAVIDQVVGAGGNPGDLDDAALLAGLIPGDTVAPLD